MIKDPQHLRYSLGLLGVFFFGSGAASGTTPLTSITTLHHAARPEHHHLGGRLALRYGYMYTVYCTLNLNGGHYMSALGALIIIVAAAGIPLLVEKIRTYIK